MAGRLVILLITMLPVALRAENIFRINITPEEAQELMAKQALELQYARKLGEVPLGQFFRGGNPETRKLYHNGRIIDNPGDYTEEIYEANQFHGQDGLGRYIYGYKDWNQAKNEARNVNGEVKGAYKYTNGAGQEIEVKYWADSEGFHQEDNLPKVKLEPVTDTPEVKAARVAHDVAWKEAAAAASAYPDPQGDYYQQGRQQHGKQLAGSVASGFQYQDVPSSQGHYQAPASAPKPYQAAASAPASHQASASSQGQYQAPNSAPASHQASASAYSPQQAAPSAPGPHQAAAAPTTLYQAPASAHKSYVGAASAPASQQASAPASHQGSAPASHQASASSYSPQQSPSASASDKSSGKWIPDENEEQGEPRGFFYNFNYEVPLIVENGARSAKGKRDAVPIDAVHDAQVHPKQRLPLYQH